MTTIKGGTRGGVGGKQGSYDASITNLGGTPDSGGGTGTLPSAVGINRSITVAMEMKSRSPSLQAIPFVCLPRGGIYVPTKIGPIQVHVLETNIFAVGRQILYSVCLFSAIIWSVYGKRWKTPRRLRVT